MSQNIPKITKFQKNKINLSSKKLEGSLSKAEFIELLRSQKTNLRTDFSVKYEVDLKKNKLSGGLEMLSNLCCSSGWILDEKKNEKGKIDVKQVLPPDSDQLLIKNSISKQSNSKNYTSKNSTSISSIISSKSIKSEITKLNIGQNQFTSIESFTGCESLINFHAFSNEIRTISPSLLNQLANLETLNLNNNKIKELPTEISNLKNLKILTMNNNLLSCIPNSIVRLENLHTLELADNKMVILPELINYMIGLVKLSCPGNKLLKLPETISFMATLRYLDVALNKLRYLPRNFDKQLRRPTRDKKDRLNEFQFHCEKNPFIQQKLITSKYLPEVLSLKELAQRLVLKNLQIRVKNPDDCPVKRYLKLGEKFVKLVSDLTETAQYCPICKSAFVSSWLECIQFFRGVGKGFEYPINARICSYACFKTPGHDFFGLAAE